MYIGRVLRLRGITHWHDENATFDSLLSRAGLGHLGEGWIVRDTPTTILTGLTGSSTQAGTCCTCILIYSLSVAVGPTAKHWPDIR